MSERLGITHDGLKVALDIKEHYRSGAPICVPGEETRILIPENLMNHDLDLHGFEDPLPLAMVAARDPEAPMALAAATRLSPLASKTRLINGVFGLVAEKTRHPLVRRSIELVSENAFSPRAISEVRRQASRVIVRSRQQYTAALRRNLKSLLDGAIAPREFVQEFFILTEAGNLRTDVRKKLVLSLLLSENIRPSIKFLFLENFQRFPKPVRLAIISGVLKADPSHHVEMIRDELKWMVTQGQLARGTH